MKLIDLINFVEEAEMVKTTFKKYKTSVRETFQEVGQEDVVMIELKWVVNHGKIG